MKKIKWTKKFATGNPSVDYEHRELIETINHTLDKISCSAETKDITALLGEIHKKISSHFALEERLMRNAGYAEYKGHKADHEKLLDEIREIMDHFEGDEGAGVEALLAGRLVAWFSVHFSTFDARLHKAL